MIVEDWIHEKTLCFVVFVSEDVTNVVRPVVLAWKLRGLRGACLVKKTGCKNQPGNYSTLKNREEEIY